MVLAESGKTRFAIELARLLQEEHLGGTFFVGLAPLESCQRAQRDRECAGCVGLGRRISLGDPLVTQ